MAGNDILVDPQLDKVLQPVSADAPCGTALTDNDGYYDLMRARHADPAVGPDELGWVGVVDGSVDLLADVGKDLRLLPILILALERSEGARGIALGIEMLHGLVDRYWPQLHPLDMADRSGNWNWFSDTILPIARDRVGTWAEEPALLAHVVARLAGLEADASVRTVPSMAAAMRALAAVLSPKVQAPALLPGASAAVAREPAERAVEDAAAPAATPVAFLASNDDAPDPEDAPLVEPFAGNPMGVNLQLADTADDDWESMRAACAPDGPFGGGTQDWSRAADAARTILAEKSKDIRAAGVLLVAAWYSEGLRGLDRAARVYRALCERHWDDLHPLEIDTRHRILAEIAEDAGRSLRKDLAPGALEKPEHQAALRSASTALNAVVASIGAKGGSRAATLVKMLSSLATPLKAAAAALPPLPVPEPKKTEPAGQPAPQPTATVAVASPTAESGTGEADEMATSEKAVEGGPEPSPEPAGARSSDNGGRSGGGVSTAAELRQSMLKIGRQMLEESPADWRAYAVLRDAALWPYAEFPTQAGGTRLMAVRSPDQQQRAFVTNLPSLLADPGQGTRRAAILLQVENALLDMPYWLDAHHAVATGLGALGAEYDQAKAVVVGAVATLVRRAPHLPAAQFYDGTPVARTETKAWIAAEILGTGQGVSVGPIEEARTLAGQDRLQDALDLLGKARAASRGGRDRFRAGLDLVGFAIDQKRLDLAASLLEDMDMESLRHDIDAWEPELAAEMLTRLLALYDRERKALRDRARQAQDPSGWTFETTVMRERQLRALAAHRRLARIDPAAAGRASIDLSRID